MWPLGSEVTWQAFAQLPNVPPSSRSDTVISSSYFPPCGAGWQLEHTPKLGRIAELGIQLVMRHDVVAVLAAGPGLQDRRRVDVRDAEALEIRRKRRGRREAELGVEL